jgi:hypothetical protein
MMRNEYDGTAWKEIERKKRQVESREKVEQGAIK